MKILFFANSRIPTERAMGTAIMKQCEAFARAGHEVELVVPQRTNACTDDPFLYHGVVKNFTVTYLSSLDIRFLGKWSVRFLLQKLSFLIALNLYIRKRDADILYTREPELIGPLITRKKKFVELHHLFGLRFLGGRFLRSCAGIIAITNALKEDVVQMFSIPAPRILVAPSGLDLSAYAHVCTKDEARHALHIETNKPIIMYTGALEEWKGYRTFLDACVLLESRVQGVLAGGSADRVATLKEQYPNVLFLGFLPQNNMPNHQQIADVFVVPNSANEAISARHTSPLKVLAHMASGVPIVASSVASIRELLSEENAVLVSPDSPEALADGIVRVLEDTEHSATIARQAQSDVQQYDWNHRTASIISFFTHEHT